jgi:hypothetical protein
MRGYWRESQLLHSNLMAPDEIACYVVSQLQKADLLVLRVLNVLGIALMTEIAPCLLMDRVIPGNLVFP